LDALIARETSNEIPHLLVECWTACHYDSNADRPFRVQALEIFEVPIKKRVLVVPLDFKGEFECVKLLNVVDFMRRSFTRDTVYTFSDFEDALFPFCIVKGVAHSLSSLCFTAARSNNLGNGDCQARKDLFDFPKGHWKVLLQNRFGVRFMPDFKSLGFQRVKHFAWPFNIPSENCESQREFISGCAACIGNCRRFYGGAGVNIATKSKRNASRWYAVLPAHNLPVNYSK
jgi:hypothetical protein